MSSPPDRPRAGIFGTSFLVGLVVVVVLFVVLLWTRGCGADDDPLDAPEQLEVEDVTDAGVDAPRADVAVRAVATAAVPAWTA